ncbi:MAG: glyoxalase [SAR324 cluster bacterium]|uniref:Glyoxalase n=1 Tax=SAR324 cluster bacterium TaxID=2024889 RepID=A0A2A4SKI5_9DELT|nr:MAG: glyoxalase [SAR324 cluster bacterium]
MSEKAKTAVPEGMHTVTTHLWFQGNCVEAIKFYKKAFGAVEATPPVTAPGFETIMHAMLSIGTSRIMMADAWPGTWEQAPAEGTTASLWLYVEKCDEAFQQAVDAGCEVIMPMSDSFWGDRFGKVKDPFGHCWALASHRWNMTPEEIAKGQRLWLASLKK